MIFFSHMTRVTNFFAGTRKVSTRHSAFFVSALFFHEVFFFYGPVALATLVYFVASPHCRTYNRGEREEIKKIKCLLHGNVQINTTFIFLFIGLAKSGLVLVKLPLEACPLSSFKRTFPLMLCYTMRASGLTL